MPDNNRKVLPSAVIKELNRSYTFTYDEEHNQILTSLSNMNRITLHDADKPFPINSVKLKRKITFNLVDIGFWKEFQQDKSLSIYSLFDIHNAINKLKVTYQRVDRTNLIDVLVNGYNQINKI